jgi:hypothetical protein
MGTPIGRIGSDKIGTETGRLTFAQPLHRTWPFLFVSRSTRRRCGASPGANVAVPAQMWAQSGPGADGGVLSSPRAAVGESRRRCGRSPGYGRASPGADQHCPVPAKMWASPVADAGGSGHWAVWNRTHSVYPPPKPMGVWLCARACMLVCARALVWLTFYPDIELASLLPLCERDTRARRFTRVRKCVCACARSSDRACMRACVRVPRATMDSPACVLRHVRS